MLDQAETLRGLMNPNCQGIRLSWHRVGFSENQFPLEALQKQIPKIHWMEAPHTADGHFVILSPGPTEPLPFKILRPTFVTVNDVTSPQDAQKIFREWILSYSHDEAAWMIYLGHWKARSERGQDFPRSLKSRFLLRWRGESKDDESIRWIAKRLHMATEGQIWA